MNALDDLSQISTALRLAIETFDNDSPGAGVSEREALHGLRDAHQQIEQLRLEIERCLADGLLVVEKDGDAYCIHLSDFVDLQTSPSMFIETLAHLSPADLLNIYERLIRERETARR